VTVRGIDHLPEFERDLDKFVDATDFAKDFIDRHGKTITKEVINQARWGRGPGGRQFKKYSKQYAARKSSQGSIWHNWMKSLDEEDRERMLDEENFSWVFEPPNMLALVWTPANEQQAAYGPAHNDGEGKMPKREWMHLEAPQTVVKIDLALERVSGNRIDSFSAKWGG